MSDEEVESLIATRKRRANAGSRLKQLLQQEEVATGANGEEDDDIDLLFQEDEDDEEFDIAKPGSDDEEDIEREGSADKSGTEQEEGENEEGEDEEDENEAEVDEDEMFSDSSSSSEEEDEEAGEKELQKQERLKKRLAAKKAKQVPKIMHKSPVKKQPSHKAPDKPKVETLLSESRRQSSRKTTVQNKLELVSKLKEDEERRKLLKPVQKVEYVELTQEEKLEEALETEKYNLLTLNKYQEQEIEKKKKQRALQLSKRKKLQDVLSFRSIVRFVSPVEEHELEKYYQKMELLNKKKKDKRGRKSDKQKREEAEALRKKQEEEEKLEQLKLKIEQEKKRIQDELKRSSSQANLEPTSEPIEKKLKSEETSGLAAEEKRISDEPQTDAKAEVAVEESKSEKPPAEPESELKAEASGETKAVADINGKESTAEVTVKDEDSDKLMSVEVAKDETPNDNGTSNDHKNNENDGEEDPEVNEVELVYEGPLQKVASNYLIFDENVRYSKEQIKSILFGEDVLLPAQRKFREVEPLVRITLDDLEHKKSGNSADDLPDLTRFNNLPKFGEFNKIKKEQVILETNKDIKIELTTQPPTGIYMKNGSKKNCFITGRPANYFDPTTGLPYSSVEAYKIIKDIHNGVYAWCEFPYGGVYVCNREELVHAKGVPEGFDE